MPAQDCGDKDDKDHRDDLDEAAYVGSGLAVSIADCNDRTRSIKDRHRTRTAERELLLEVSTRSRLKTFKNV